MRRKAWKRLTAIGLAALMLAGCGTQNAGTADQAASKESKTTEDTVQAGGEETVETTAADYPDYLNLDSYRPIVKDGEEVTLKVVTRRESIASSDINENFFVKFIEDKMNINLEIEEVTSETYQERKNLMFASDDLPDIIIYMGMTASEVVNYGVDGGQLLPISDYFSEELTPNILEIFESYPEAKVENTAPDGKIYGLPRILAEYPGKEGMMGTQRVFIDTKYMEAANIEKVPETLDDFVDMLRAFKALDPASMGVDEIWPIVSTWGNDKELFLNAFGWLGTDATAPVWDVETNEVVIPCSQEKYGEYVKLLNTLYSEGLIHPDFFTIDKTAARALYAEGSIPVIADAAPYLSVPDTFADYVSAIPLSSQWCENGVTRKGLSYSFGQVYVSADTEYPEVCVRLLDYLYSDEGSLYSYYGCPADSEDAMGLIGGFYYDENGKMVFNDVADGKYESAFDYAVNAIELGQDMCYDQNKIVLYSQELCGIENPSFPELDLTDPDDHYRYLCYEAHQGHMVAGLPSMYMSADMSARYTDLNTVIANYVNAETAKFVVGQRSLDEIPAYFEELKALGIDEYVEICRKAYADYEGPQE